MTLQRTFEAEFINRVLNHPDVREGAGAPREAKYDIDMTETLQDIKNVCLVTLGGGFLLLHKAPGTYDLHTQFLPDARGTEPLQAIEQAFYYMFIDTDCAVINTKVHKDNVGALTITEKYAELMGYHDDYYYFTLTYEAWVKRSQRCRERGERFHRELGDQKAHGDDKIHDRHTGSALLMAEAGNLGKCEFYYNRYALSSGYATMQMLSLQPAIIQIGDFKMFLQHVFEVGVE